MTSEKFCKLRANISGFLWFSTLILGIIGLIFLLIAIASDISKLSSL